MKSKIIAASVVFTVGFIVGLGLTYALLSKAPPVAAKVENESVATTAAADEQPEAKDDSANSKGPGTMDKTAMPTEGAKAPTDLKTPPAEPPKVAEKKWWEGLKGKTCRVDMGRAGALIKRQGGLADGEVVDWMTRFGRNPRIGLIPKDDQIRLLVHGVGVDITGTPVAAMVTVELEKNKKTGIIALHTQGLNVSLHPIK